MGSPGKVVWAYANTYVKLNTDTHTHARTCKDNSQKEMNNNIS